MKRKVDKIDFRKVLCRRPALLRKVVNPSEYFLASCIISNSDVLKFMDEKQFTPTLIVKVIQVLIRKNIWNHSSYIRDLKCHAGEAMIQIPEPLLQKYLDKYRQDTPLFPNASYDLWLRYTAEGLGQYQNTPEQHRTEDILSNIILSSPVLFQSRPLPMPLLKKLSTKT